MSADSVRSSLFKKVNFWKFFELLLNFVSVGNLNLIYNNSQEYIWKKVQQEGYYKIKQKFVVQAKNYQLLFSKPNLIFRAKFSDKICEKSYFVKLLLNSSEERFTAFVRTVLNLSGWKTYWEKGTTKKF